jgi:hypothetical protein
MHRTIPLVIKSEEEKVTAGNEVVASAVISSLQQQHHESLAGHNLMKTQDKNNVVTSIPPLLSSSSCLKSVSSTFNVEWKNTVAWGLLKGFPWWPIFICDARLVRSHLAHLGIGICYDDDDDDDDLSRIVGLQLRCKTFEYASIYAKYVSLSIYIYNASDVCCWLCGSMFSLGKQKKWRPEQLAMRHIFLKCLCMNHNVIVAD